MDDAVPGSAIAVHIFGDFQQYNPGNPKTPATFGGPYEIHRWQQTEKGVVESFVPQIIILTTCYSKAAIASIIC